MVFTGSFIEWAVVFFVLALVAGAAGMSSVAGVSMRVARVFVAVFLLLALIAILL